MAGDGTNFCSQMGAACSTVFLSYAPVLRELLKSAWFHGFDSATGHPEING